MDFNLTEEQQLLRDSVERLAREQYNFEARRALLKTPAGVSDEHWQSFADLGWLALGIPEEFGGLGLGFVEVSILMQGLGAAMVLEPLVSTTVLGARIVERADNDSQRHALLPQVAEGGLKVALAHSEAFNRFHPANVKATVVDHGEDGYILSGSKFMAFDAPSAEVMIVSAKMSGKEDFGLFLVDRQAEGVALDPYRLIDGTSAADIRFDRVHLGAEALLVAPERALDVLEEAVDRSTLAQVAEAIGAMGAVMEITAEYIKTRKQFGQPIGKFQALQHRMAEMLTRTEDARSMLYRALANLETEPAARKAAVSAAKVVAAEAGKFVGAQGIQLHGGMGMTDECSVSHYFKRFLVFEKAYGDLDYHTARYIAASG